MNKLKNIISDIWAVLRGEWAQGKRSWSVSKTIQQRRFFQGTQLCALEVLSYNWGKISTVRPRCSLRAWLAMTWCFRSLSELMGPRRAVTRADEQSPIHPCSHGKRANILQSHKSCKKKDVIASWCEIHICWLKFCGIIFICYKVFTHWKQF